MKNKVYWGVGITLLAIVMSATYLLNSGFDDTDFPTVQTVLELPKHQGGLCRCGSSQHCQSRDCPFCLNCKSSGLVKEYSGTKFVLLNDRGDPVMQFVDEGGAFLYILDTKGRWRKISLVKLAEKL